MQGPRVWASGFLDWHIHPFALIYVLSLAVPAADGYIKVARGKYDCGVASDGIVAVVSKQALRPGADYRRLEAVRRW